MGGVGLTIIFIVIVSGIQILLSLKKPYYLGYMIPGLNALVATAFGMMGSDYFTGYFTFIVLLLPILMWLAIYKLCRDRVNNKAENDMKKSRVKDL